MTNLYMRSLENNQGYYDPWESITGTERERATRSKLENYISFARSQAPFYKDRLDAADFSVEHPLHRVPILNSSDMRLNLPPVSDALLSTERDTVTVFQSGGTTGGAKTTLFSSGELDALDLHNARGFFALGLTPKDKVANLFAVGGLYMTFVHINRCLQQYGCMNFPFSNHTPHDFIQTVSTAFDINCFTGISSVVLSALRALHDSGVGDLKIDKVLYGGEHLYEADKEEIRSKFGTEVIAAPGYGTVDSWYIGYQCLHCPTGVFHSHDDGCYIEIINEETGEACGRGETGSLLATATARRLTPIVRYRVGDRARWLNEPCACGRTTPLFQLLGRADDVLRIGFDSVDYAFVQKAAQLVHGATGTIQMEKVRRQGKDELIVRVECAVPTDEWLRIEREMAALITDERPSLREFVQQGSVWPVVVQCVPMESLPRNPRTGKLMRIIDAIKE